jgi:hypothetical protein
VYFFARPLVQSAMRIVATLALASSMLFGADTKRLASHDGACAAAVPATWEVSALGGIAGSPDKKISVAVGSPQRVASFDALKANAKKLYTKDKVTRDSASDFVMEGLSISGKPNVYRGIAIPGNKFCTIEVIYEGGTAADARKIAETLTAGK